MAGGPSARGKRSEAEPLAEALSALCELKPELEAVAKLVIRYRDEIGPLPPKLAELPTRLQHAASQCKFAHRQLSGARAELCGRASRRQDERPPQSATSASTLEESSPNKKSDRSARPEHRGQHLSAGALPTDIGRQVAVEANSESPHSQSRQRAVRPRSPRPGSPTKRGLMLSRWPENEVSPRAALSNREEVIKEDPAHPLHVLYAQAPGHKGPGPSDSEITALHAVQDLVSLRMVGGMKAQNRNWLRCVFLEWVAVAVGARDRRARKVSRSVARSREFFSEGKGGVRIHLNRRPEDRRTTLAPGACEDRPRPPSPIHAFMNRVKDAAHTPQRATQLWDRASSLGLPVPSSTSTPVPPRLLSVISNMHTPWAERNGYFDQFDS